MDDDYRELWKLAEELAPAGEDPGSAFEEVGLLVEAAPHCWEYWCTPVNSRTFASTGVDGVHFGQIVRKDGSAGPVVMTVPMCDTPNVVLGEDLREFLALGCRTGYVALDELIYARTERLPSLRSRSFAEGTSGREQQLLTQLADRFGLAPWADPEDRLLELAREFDSLLELPDREE